MADNWTKGFGTAPARAGGNFVNPGVYDVTLTAFVRRTSQKPETSGHQLVILEARVDEVVVAYPEGDGFGASNARNESLSVINNVSKHGATAWANVKGQLLAILRATALAQGEDPPSEGDLSPEAWESALAAAVEGAGTAFAGTRLRIHASKGSTRAKNPFTNLRFEALPPRAEAA